MRGVDDLRPDQPISLKAACEIIFDGSVTPVTLKAEHKRGNLEIVKIGRAYFTTLRHVETMIEKCRLPMRVLGTNASSVDNQTEEARNRASRAAALALAESLKKSRQRFIRRKT
ncbi:hypothetical protein [Bradyrhizobium sp. F1.13.3]|uniref:hypothetical protein n=1 Tax=Bradyrhizobium sp. F1.13.3 TaxID=3156351 RepID=UPI003396C3CF